MENSYPTGSIKQSGWENFEKLLNEQCRYMPCPFTGRKMFCASPNFLCRTQKFIYIFCQTKSWFAFSKIVFCAHTKILEEALNVVKIFGWLKKFESARNILWLVRGHGIKLHTSRNVKKSVKLTQVEYIFDFLDRWTVWLDR